MSIKFPEPNIDRYLAIMRWARWRYTKNGALVLSVGGKPSPFMRIEYRAARRYLLNIGFTHGKKSPTPPAEARAVDAAFRS